MITAVTRPARLGALAAAAALSLAPVGASALNISMTANSPWAIGQLTEAQDDFTAMIGSQLVFGSEDFEDFETVGQIDFYDPPGVGENISDSELSTAVGTFTTLGGVGTGATAIDKNNGKNLLERGQNLAIRKDDDTPHSNGGRQNTSNGVGDVTYLDSNDTEGFKWTAGIGGSLFNRLWFTLTDPSDQGKTLTITANNNTTQSFQIPSPQINGGIFNIEIAFDSDVSSAMVSLAKNGTNDGFSIDNATVGAVPLPAAAWLLLGVSGALVAAKRRSARHAA
jgi:hypothetical protein